MDSLLTMLLFQYMIDRPGFQGNATFDTSRNTWTNFRGQDHSCRSKPL